MASPKNPADSIKLDNPDFEDRDSPRADDRGGEERGHGPRHYEAANEPTDPERRRRFREKWASTHLPNLPKKAGWHRCWVSVNHPTDTPERRIAAGYSYVDSEDLKSQGWVPQAERPGKDGSAVGAGNTVRWREMVAMECTEDDYQMYMREFHLDQPRDAMRDIFEPLTEMGERIKEQGGRVEMGDGIKEALRYRKPIGHFD